MSDLNPSLINPNLINPSSINPSLINPSSINPSLINPSSIRTSTDTLESNDPWYDDFVPDDPPPDDMAVKPEEFEDGVQYNACASSKVTDTGLISDLKEWFMRTSLKFYDRFLSDREERKRQEELARKKAKRVKFDSQLTYIPYIGGWAEPSSNVENIWENNRRIMRKPDGVNFTIRLVSPNTSQPSGMWPQRRRSRFPTETLQCDMTVKELCDEYGITERDVRQAVKNRKRQGYMVLGKPRAGKNIEATH